MTTSPENGEDYSGIANRGPVSVSRFVWPVVVYALIALVIVAATYETLFAFQVIHLPVGGQSGNAPRFENPLIPTADIAMAIASLVFLAAGLRRRLSRRLAAVNGLWLLVVASAALVVARLYTFDPYYAPHLRRASTNTTGNLLYWWLPIGIVGAGLVALLVARLPRVAMLLTSAILLYAALSVILLRGFH